LGAFADGGAGRCLSIIPVTRLSAIFMLCPSLHPHQCSPPNNNPHVPNQTEMTNDVLWGSVSDEQRVYCWVGSVCMVAEWFWYMVFQ
jgi:hypothetical protein